MSIYPSKKIPNTSRELKLCWNLLLYQLKLGLQIKVCRYVSLLPYLGKSLASEGYIYHLIHMYHLSSQICYHNFNLVVFAKIPKSRILNSDHKNKMV